MSPMSKKEYLQAILGRYQKVGRHEKSRILDEFCATSGYHRKSAIRKLRQPQRPAKPKRKKPGRPSRYNHPAILKSLKLIWHTSHYPCSKRLKAILPLWLVPYQYTFGHLPVQVCKALLRVSPATIDRLLKTTRIRSKRRGLTSTKPGKLLKTHIPIKTNQWDQSKPGFLEADTVAHCGTSLAGAFVYTLDTTDIATGWSEQRAIWGKGESAVLTQMKHIEASLPFPILGFDCDNGSEFLNWHLVCHFQKRKRPIQFTRSRPYHKDDNAHIEQKNWTHVRQWLGYRRFEDPEILELLNDLYTSEWRLLHNFFLPSVKLLEKRRIRSKIVKVHDDPKTPYQRILESKYIDKPVKEQLKRQYQTLNPFQLRKAIDEKIIRIRHLAR